MTNITIIEDDKLLNQALAISLEKDGFSVTCGFSCREGMVLAEHNPDLMLIDINLPDGEGFDICKKAREVGQIPCIFLTARDEEIDMIKAFDSGCDDYVVKPFPMSVLKKRIVALLRRSGEEKQLFAYKGLQMDFDSKQVLYQQKEIKLTAKEYRLLEFLVKNQGQVLSRDHILQALWDGEGAFVEENTLSVTVNRLRKKIEPDITTPIFIRNIFGMGYTFGGQ